MRLHQFLSRSGKFSSKSLAIEAVRQGRVRIGSSVVSNPDFIFEPSKRRVYLDGAPLSLPGRVYIALYKPRGFLSSRLSASDIQLGKRSAFALLGLPQDVLSSLVCVGRLDEDTSGLLLFTNDGKFASSVAKPGGFSKTYQAVLSHPLSASALEAIENGISIVLEENGRHFQYRTKPCKVRQQGNLLEIDLSEGKKRQLRRMVEAAGSTVISLKRVSVGSLSLGTLNLKEGEWVEIKPSLLGEPQRH